MIESLEQVLADEREQAQVLRHNGHRHDAELIERVCDRVKAAAEDYLTFLEEGEANLHSGRSTEWLRSKFNEWLSRGHAKIVDKRRYYRMLVLPQRANLSAEREAGRRAARGEAA